MYAIRSYYDEDVGQLPPGIDRGDQREAVREVRRIAQEGAALVQALAHELVLHLVEVLDRRFEIAHAAVHQLGAAARCAAREIAALDQRDGKSARGSVRGDASYNFV